MISINDPRVKPYLTPVRLDKPVLEPSGVPGAFDEKGVDCPFVFRHNGRFYMVYTGFDGTGYQSALAVSDDLVSWRHSHMILERSELTRSGGAVTWLIKKSDALEDVPELDKVNGRYWGVYHAYPGTGYETGPAEIGLIWCEDEELRVWHHLEKPVFSWKDGAEWEHGGLYKACVVRKDGRWCLFYNAKNAETAWTEQTGVAFSEDLIHWTRYENNPVLRVTPGAWDQRFVSDPYVVSDRGKWLNFYFGLGPGHAQEGLAFSDDLLTWEKVDAPILPAGAPGRPDSHHCHKASVLKYNGKLYHFYCGTRPVQTGDPCELYGDYRTICLAVSGGQD